MVISQISDRLFSPSALAFPKSVQRGILKAAAFSQMSEAPNFRVGAVVIRNGRVVSGGWNWHKKTHPQSNARNKGIHAEFHCLFRCDADQLKGAVLFVARTTKRGLLAIAKPCEGCQTLLQGYGFKRIYFTDDNGDIGMMKIA